MKKNFKLLIIFILTFIFMSDIKAMDIKESLKEYDFNVWSVNSTSTYDGGYMVSGILGNDSKSILIKFNKNDEIEWKKEYALKRISQIVKTNDSNYMLIDSLTSDVVKIDKDGNIIWKKQISDVKYFYFSVAITKDDSFLVYGNNYNEGKRNLYVTKYDKSGNKLWRDVLSSDKEIHFTNVIEIESKSEYIVTYQDENFKHYFIKYDKNGNKISEMDITDKKIERIKAGFGDELIVIAEDSKNNLYVSSRDTNLENIKWKKTLTDYENDKIVSSELIKTDDGFLIVVDNDFFVGFKAYAIKIDKLGNIQYETEFAEKSNMDAPISFVQKSKNEYILVGAPRIQQAKLYVYKITEPKYEFEKLDTNIYEKEELSDLTFKCDGELELLDKVYINGNELPKEYYTLKKGSTIITIKKEYLSKLDKGNYTLELKYSNGKVAKTSFQIESKEEETKTENVKNPATSDNVGFYIGVLTLSLLGMIKSLCYLKLRND